MAQHPEELNDALHRASLLVASASHVVALVGAGLSVESGIPTYRGPGGLWTRLGQPNPLSFQTFLKDPADWWRNHMDPQQGPRAEFRRALEQAQPNLGHHALAELEAMDVLRHTITQNVDNLHQMAGSTRVAEVHGNRYRLRCMECVARFPRDGLHVTELPPRCPKCSGILKSDTVMFGEAIPLDVLEVCFQQTERCDCMLLVGTSATVYPAAGFPEAVRQRGGSLIEINPKQTPHSDDSDVVLRAPSGEVLPPLAAQVRELLEARNPRG